MVEKNLLRIFFIIILILLNCNNVFAAWTPQFKDSFGNIIPGSIAKLEQIELGGVKQWILIRGRNINNPILLFLHGGPGSSVMPLIRHYNRELENHFIVVNWEQRGAGKSYSRKLSEEDLTLEQYIADAYELINMLRKRMNKDKIFLVGHSWGSILGVYLVQRYPELFHAFIGVGQGVNGMENEKISYQYTLTMARETNNKKALRDLEKMGNPPVYIDTYFAGDWFDHLRKQRKWLLRMGGCLYNKRSYRGFIKYFLISPEYTIIDLINWIKGNIFSVKAMWGEIMEVNLPEQVPSLKVPVYFLMGKHDYNTPVELVISYYEKLDAPVKEIVWFEYSAHSPIFEEPEKFNEIMINKILPETIKTINSSDGYIEERRE